MGRARRREPPRLRIFLRARLFVECRQCRCPRAGRQRSWIGADSAGDGPPAARAVDPPIEACAEMAAVRPPGADRLAQRFLDVARPAGTQSVVDSPPGPGGLGRRRLAGGVGPGTYCPSSPTAPRAGTWSASCPEAPILSATWTPAAPRFFRMLTRRGLRFYGRALAEGARLAFDKVPDQTREAIALIELAADAVSETLPASTGSLLVVHNWCGLHDRTEQTVTGTGTGARRQAWLCFVKRLHRPLSGSDCSFVTGAAQAGKR